MIATIFFLDTFTTKAFTGNPTPVCCSNSHLDKPVMQSIAAELNLPVTAFVFKKEKASHYDIQYFTPITEIPACGHATLAAARVLMQADNVSQLTFHTGRGLAIDAYLKDDAIMMSYPRYEWQKSDVAMETMKSLGIDTYKSAAFSPELETLFIELDNGDLLRKIQPDFIRLTNSSDHIKEVVITSAPDSPQYDYLLRSFCPWIGIDEDPVTGSVHSVLGPYWQQRSNKSNLTAYQASARGGVLLINAFDNRVDIGGHSVIIMKGEMSY